MSLFCKGSIASYASRSIWRYTQDASLLSKGLALQHRRFFQVSAISTSEKQDPDHKAVKSKSKLLYEGDETSESKLFAVGSSLATRLSIDKTLHCTEFDADGNVVGGNQEIKKSALVSKFGILARDLRKIDDNHDFPIILVRPTTILVNFLQHRALITATCVLVLHLPSSPSPSHDSAFMYGLQETILIMVLSELEIEYQELKKPVKHLLEEMEKNVDPAQLKKLLDVTKQVSFFKQKVKLVRSALHTVLDADDDMANMYLGEKAAGAPRAEESHDEIEMLLENYYEASGEIVEKADKLLSDLDYTHDSVRSILDSHRNSIMMIDVHFSIAMLGIATGTYIAGLYGMNLINGLEEATHGFPVITGGSFLSILGVGLWGLVKLRRIKRVYHMHSSLRHWGSKK